MQKPLLKHKFNYAKKTALKVKSKNHSGIICLALPEELIHSRLFDIHFLLYFNFLAFLQQSGASSDWDIKIIL